MMPSGVWAATNRSTPLDDLGRVLVGDEAEGQLDERVARHDRLVAVALVAAADPVDLGGRPGADPLQRRVAASPSSARDCATFEELAPRRPAPWRTAPARRRSARGRRRRSRAPAPVRASSCSAATSRAMPVAGFGTAPPNTPECRSRSGPWKLTVQADHAAHAGDRARDVGGDHAGVGDDDDVAVEPVAVLGEQRPRSSASRTPPRPRHELQVTAGAVAPGGGEVRAQAEQVEQQLALVVGRAAGPQHVAVDRRVERVGVPQLERVDRLHVVVRRTPGRSGASGVVARPLGVDGRQPGGRPDLDESGSRCGGRRRRTTRRCGARRRGARAGR